MCEKSNGLYAKPSCLGIMRHLGSRVEASKRCYMVVCLSIMRVRERERV